MGCVNLHSHTQVCTYSIHIRIFYEEPEYGDLWLLTQDRKPKKDHFFVIEGAPSFLGMVGVTVDFHNVIMVRNQLLVITI